jgi:probable addiction module antidote protein
MQRKKAKSKRRIRLTKGNFGDSKSLQGGLYEMRIDVGPGAGSGHQAGSGNDAAIGVMVMRKRKLELAPFDASEFLDNEKVIAEYLAQALKDPDPDMFLVAVANVAKARGLSQVAKDSGLGRESLYKALKPGSKIRYETVRRLVDSLGVHLTVKAT